MVVNEISEVMEKRRNELVEMLENNRHNLNLEKQHQLYGAINEIDLFIQTIEFYRNNSSPDEKPIQLVKPPEEEKGLFTKIFEDLKDKVKKNR